LSHEHHRPKADWPPLIVADREPRWLWWRDFIFTAAAWLLFGALVEKEFSFLRALYREKVEHLPVTVHSHWGLFTSELRPDFVVIAVLLLFLGGSGAITLRRRRRGFLMSPPAPLAPAAEAQRVGMAEGDLSVARGLRIAVLHVDSGGRVRVESR